MTLSLLQDATYPQYRSNLNSRSSTPDLASGSKGCFAVQSLCTFHVDIWPSCGRRCWPRSRLRARRFSASLINKGRASVMRPGQGYAYILSVLRSSV